MSIKITNLLVGAAVAGLLANAAMIKPTLAEESKAPAPKPHIDLAFCIDTTGSMQGEIENVKAKTKELVAKLAGGKPSPVIRVGLVAFRDQGDDYVTKVFPFTEDIDKVVKDISSLKADGGGDEPEAVNQALHASVNDLKWSGDKKTLKMLFLIGDAGPNTSNSREFDWKTEAKSAIAHGIQINTLGCQGLENFPEATGVGVFKEIAKLADGKYEALAYRQEVAGADGKRETIISSGGGLYRVKSKSADAWKAGFAALSARGEVDKLSETSGASAGGGAFASASPMMAADAPSFVGVRGGSLEARPMSSSVRGRAFVRDYRAAAPSAYVGGAIGRGDNNLADIVLQATKEAAAKKLNVEFK